MTGSSEKKLPKFASVDDLVDFFDENDTSDYIDAMPEAHFEIDIKQRKHLVEIEGEIAEQISKISRTERVPTGVIVNAWLREKLTTYRETH